MIDLKNKIALVSDDWLRERFHTMVLATDLHQNSRLALAYAVSFALHFESKLTALHAFEFGPYSQAVEVLDHLPSKERTDAEELLQRFISEAGHPEVVSEVVVIEGFVASAIIKVISDKAADLLIMGTEGVHKGFNHLLLGSNTEALMLGAGCLTLTVGPYVAESVAQKLQFRKVIYVSDFSLASTAAATYALTLARTFGLDTTIYQLASKAALKDLPRLKKTAAQYCDVLHFSNPDLPEAWFNPEYQLARIVPEADLLAAISEPSNLIVLGIHPASFLQRHLQTSLAYRLLVSAASPVLTVPAGAPLKRTAKAI